MNAVIALEDGTVFHGESFGAPGEALGEVVFNTSMTGYQEVLTDPSYCSQIVTMTYPLVGNYGVNEEDVESDRIQVAGFVVREVCEVPSNFASRKSLPDYLRENGIIGITGVDTRALTRHIRLAGAMKAAMYAGDDPPPGDLVEKARAWAGLVGVDTVKDVTCSRPYRWGEHEQETGEKNDSSRLNVVALDCGIKYTILRILTRFGCNVTVVPAATSAADILAMNPDGVFLSNGPGDPAGPTYAIETVRELVGTRPLFGICLGHQLLGSALGGKTYKLKFGHHGANHPVRDLQTGEIAITSQNHGFCIDLESLSGQGVEVTHINLNDKTCEGLSDSRRRFFSVQYHPEAAPGPHDSGYLFERFVTMMKN